MSNSIEKVIELIKKTGDKCIILDAEGNPQYVAMRFKDYEKIVYGNFDVKGLTEDELIERINRSIATWRATQTESRLKDWEPSEEVVKEIPGLTPANDQNLAKNPEIASDSLNQAKNDDSEGKYYFEPIE